MSSFRDRRANGQLPSFDFMECHTPMVPMLLDQLWTTFENSSLLEMRLLPVELASGLSGIGSSSR
jgi:hypothetical protein